MVTNRNEWNRRLLKLCRSKRFSAAILAGVCLLLTPAWCLSDDRDGGKPDKPSKNLLDEVQRRIVREPSYTSSPRYALLLLGTNVESKVWIVEDGKSLYVDRNGNGDLTDDGPPIEPSNVRTLGRLPNGSPKFDFDYVLDEIRPEDGSRHTDFRLARWNYGDDQDEYGLKLKLNGEIPMYAGWTAFWGKTPEEAPLIHFGGPLQIRMLRFKEFVLAPGVGRLSIAFVNLGRGEGAHSRLSIAAVPEENVPVVEIDWPVRDGAPSIRTTYRLTERCCYWEFYSRDFSMPREAVPGTATLKVLLPDGKLPLELSSDQIEVQVRREDGSAAEK